MNPGVLQYKNCWKWSHLAGVCRIQGTKYVKYNSPHQTIHYREFAWYCKANKKINSPRLKTKKGEPCLHLFKCSNCKRDHQANSTEYSFWKYYFNKEWHLKKYMKICEIQKESICLVMNSKKIWFTKILNYFHRTFGKIH